jgi:hypothetical protein
MTSSVEMHGSTIGDSTMKLKHVGGISKESMSEINVLAVHLNEILDMEEAHRLLLRFWYGNECEMMVYENRSPNAHSTFHNPCEETIRMRREYMMCGLKDRYNPKLMPALYGGLLDGCFYVEIYAAVKDESGVSRGRADRWWHHVSIEDQIKQGEAEVSVEAREGEPDNRVRQPRKKLHCYCCEKGQQI